MRQVNSRQHLVFAASLAAGFLAPAVVYAGPYSTGLENSNVGAIDSAIPGFIGSVGAGKAAAPNVINPAFTGWATGCLAYEPADGVDPAWSNPDAALGPATGNNFDIVSLGDLNAAQLAAGMQPGRITLSFKGGIGNGNGVDFAIFENAHGSASFTFSELAHVEVSSDGEHFSRFRSTSLTPAAVGPYGSIDPTNVYNLAGKHINAYGNSWGTPFDLDDLGSDPLVQSGDVKLHGIQYVRLIDIPGNGSFTDSLDRPIYDAWVTFGSGGTDLEAVGVINGWLGGDATLDGQVDVGDLGVLASNWQQSPRQFAQGDFNLDGTVNVGDLGILASNWQRGAGSPGEALAAMGLPATAVPEPAGIVLLALALGALGMRQRLGLRLPGRGVFTVSAAAIGAGLATMAMAVTTVDFEDLSLPAESAYTGADGAGGFSSRGARFNNSYTDWGGGFFSWDGFAYSNRTDTTTPGFASQFSAIAGGGAGGTGVYGVAYVGSPVISLPAGASPVSLDITNTTYAYLSMRDGDSFSKKFGGAGGGDPDFLKLSIIGKDSAGTTVGTKEFYLADFRAADNERDYILDSWTTVDLTELSGSQQLTFSLDSSDVGQFGINTPTYFALDNLAYVPEPAASGLMGLLLCQLAHRARRCRG